MNLENLVCTPEQSRKFAELGLFGESVLVWGSRPYVGRLEILLRSEILVTGPATTMQELGEWLNEKLESSGGVEWVDLQDAWYESIGADAAYLAAKVIEIMERQ